MKPIKTRLVRRSCNSLEYDVVEPVDEPSPSRKTKSTEKLQENKVRQTNDITNKRVTRNSGRLINNVEEDKTQTLKRKITDDKELISLPLKKRIKEKIEKENKLIESKNNGQAVTKDKANKVLENLSLPRNEINTKGNEKTDCDTDFSDNELDEMFLKLRRSGVKTVKTPLNHNKYSPKSSEKNNLHVPRIISNIENESSPASNRKQSKKKLFEEFTDGFSEREEMNIISPEKKVPELEKPPEDLILNFKRVSRKVNLGIEETPKKQKSDDSTTKSSRRKSLLKKNFESDTEKTPVRRPDRTPKKGSSSVKKKILKEVGTPISKSTEKLPRTPLEKARLSLHVSTVPDSLPCREKEYNNILTFLENKLWDGIGGCMYISGVPGTGKTATVTQVIRHLEKQSDEGLIPEFKYVEINGMRLADPRQAYVQLWQKLFDRKEKITPDRAYKNLDEWFSKSDRKNAKITTILLVDELDLVCTKKQDVVYNLLDWPTRTHSRLVVLTIANTMDMPERLFKGRVTSRMGLTRLTFVPYTHKQLEEIVLARLSGLNAFVSDAVRLVTRKVAAVSGDARRALDICRRATELPRSDETVKISHIEQAIREMTNSNIVKVIRNCSEMEKLFLRSLNDVSLRSSVDEVDLREVIDQLLPICTLEGVPRPSMSSILSVTNRLKCSRLIFANHSNAGILQGLTLNVTQDDIHYALTN